MRLCTLLTATVIVAVVVCPWSPRADGSVPRAAPVTGFAVDFGGSGEDIVFDIKTDQYGNVYITGSTTSADLQLTSPLDATYGGVADAFIAKLDSAGHVVWSTYFGGSGYDEGDDIDVDAAGNVFVVGTTNSADLATTAGAFQTAPRGAIDAFVLTISPGGDRVGFVTYLGGAGDDLGIGLAVDPLGRAVVTGHTASSNFPVARAFQTANRNPHGSAFVSLLDAAGAALVYSSFLGGSGSAVTNGDFGLAVALDGVGAAYVTGFTDSSNFPTRSAVQSRFGGGGFDAFATKVSVDGALVYSTYLGGGGSDGASGIAVDPRGNAVVAGDTTSTNFPMRDAPQPQNAGGLDEFIAQIGPADGELLFSTYYGGSGDDRVNGLALDAFDNAYAVGFTKSLDFPTTERAPKAPRQDFGFASVTKVAVGTANHGVIGALTSSGLLGNAITVGEGIAIGPGSASLYLGLSFQITEGSDHQYEIDCSNLNQMCSFGPTPSAPPSVFSTAIPTTAEPSLHQLAVALHNTGSSGIPSGAVVTPHSFTPFLVQGAGLILGETAFNVFPTGATDVFTVSCNADPDIAVVSPGAVTEYGLNIVGSSMPQLGAGHPISIPGLEVTSMTSFDGGSGGPCSVVLGLRDPSQRVFSLEVFRRTTGGEFGNPVLSVPLPTEAMDLSSGDFNGDGLQDLVVVRAPEEVGGSTTIVVGLGDGSGASFDFNTFDMFVATPGAVSVNVGRFNGDPLDDLVYVDFEENFAAVALSDGTNFFLAPNYRETGGFIPVAVAIGDINTDDNLDVLVAHAVPGSVSVLGGDGKGDLAPIQLVSGIGDGTVTLPRVIPLAVAPVSPGSGRFDDLIDAAILGFSHDVLLRRTLVDGLGPDVRRPTITGIASQGKNLVVSGTDFSDGAKVLVNGVSYKTKRDPHDPGTRLLSKKALKSIGPGETVSVQVLNGDGIVSENTYFTRP